MRVHGLDEFYFLAASPPFDFFFAIDGGVGIEKALVVDETGQIAAAGESGNEFILVLQTRRVKVPVMRVYKTWEREQLVIM